MITTFELSGEESDDDLKGIAWQMFCSAHPVEAYRKDPDAFWKYFQTVAPGVSRERMEQIVKECEESSEQ